MKPFVIDKSSELQELKAKNKRLEELVDNLTRSLNKKNNQLARAELLSENLSITCQILIDRYNSLKRGETTEKNG